MGHSPPIKRRQAYGAHAEYEGDRPVGDKVRELEDSLASERSKNDAKEVEVNELREQVKKLQDELLETKNMYQECERKLKSRVAGESATDAERLEELNKEKQKLADTYKHALEGEIEVDP
jgi:TolA-binding protein